MQFLAVLWSNKTVRWGILISVGLILFYLWARAAGKRKAKEQMKEAPLPNGGSQIPVGWDPKSLANELYTALDGIATWASTKENTFAKAMAMTDDQLTAVYNAFNRLFGPRGKGTLTDWLRDEFNVVPNGLRNRLVDRLVSLNLL